MAATTSSSNLITVSCVNHHQILFNGLCNLFLNKQKADCEMEHNGRSIRVHRLLLDVFMSPESVQLHTAPDLTPAADPDDPDSNSLDLLVEFLYRGRVSVRRDQLPGLMKVAKVCKFHMLVGAVQVAMKREENKNDVTAGTRKSKVGQVSQKLAPKLQQKAAIGGESKPETRSSCNLTNPEKVDAELEIYEMELPSQSKTGSRKRAHEGGEDSSDCISDDSLSGSDEPVDTQSDIQHDSDESDEGDDVVHPRQSDEVPPTPPPVILTGVHPSWNRELGAYQCSGCPRTFANVRPLNIHARIHGERPFACEHCAQRFHHLHVLVAHRRTHTVQELYDCLLMCGKSFKSMSSLRDHMQTHHDDGD